MPETPTAIGFLGGASATSAGTTIVLVANQTIPAGTFIHITGTWDNINSVTAPTITCSTVGGGTATANHATAVGSGITTTAGAGVWHQCFRVLTTSSISSGATIATLTSNQSAVKRIASAHGWSGALTTLRGTVATGTSTSGAPSAASAGTALVAGDLVIGSVSFENNSQATGDADSTNGSWSAISGQTPTTGGSANTNVGASAQGKVVSATGTQTYNPTTSNDSIACVYSVQPDPVQAAAATLAVTTAVTAVGSKPTVPMTALTDDFATTLDTGKWTNGGSATVSGGAAHFPANGYGSAQSIYSVGSYELTSSELVVEVPALPSTDTADGPFFTIELFNGPTQGPANNYLRWFYYSGTPGAGTWEPEYKNTGTQQSGTAIASGSATRWLRIKHNGTDVLWDTSPDGTTWTNRWTQSVATVNVDFTALSVAFRAGADTTNTGTFDVDNVNLPPSGGTTHSAGGTLAVTSAGVAAATRDVPVAGSLAVTAGRTAAVVAVHEAGGTLAVTANRTAAAARDVPIAGTLAVTEAGTSAGARTVSASSALVITEAALAAVTRDVPAAGSLAVTAASTAAATQAFGAGGSLAVTANRTALTAAVREALSALAVTAGRTTSAARDVPISGTLPITAAGASSAAQTQVASAALGITATLVTEAAGVAGPKEASSALAVTSGLAAVAVRGVEAAAARPITAALVAAATRTVAGAAALPVTAAATASAGAVHAASATLAVTVARTAEATKTGQQDGAGTLGVAATLTSAASVVHPASAALAVTSAQVAAAERAKAADAARPVTVGLTAAAQVVRAAEAILTATAASSADVARFVTAESRLDVTAELEALATSIRPDIPADLTVPVQDHRVLVGSGVGSGTIAVNGRETTVSVGTREVLA